MTRIAEDKLAPEPSPRAFINHRGQVSELVKPPWEVCGLTGLASARVYVARHSRDRDELTEFLAALGIHIGAENE